MPNNVLSYIAAGFDRLEGHVLDTASIVAGTGSITAGAAGAAGFRMVGVKTAEIAVPEPQAEPVTGDNAYLGGFIFPSNAVRAFTVEIAVNNMTNTGIFQQSNTINIGNSSVGFLDIVDPTYPTITLIGVSNAQSQASGTTGQGMFGGVIIPRCQIVPLGRGSFSERSAASFRARVVISASDGFPWGETFTTGVHGTLGATLVEWTDTYRKSFHRFTGTGAVTGFGPLQYTPASTSLSDVIVYQIDSVTGIPTRKTTGVTVDTASKMLTFSVAPANGDKVVVFYSYVI